MNARTLPSIPLRSSPPSGLQDPAFPDQLKEDRTAPLSEFLAAGSLLTGFVMVIVGSILTTPAILIAGLVVMVGVTGLFAVARKAFSFGQFAGSYLWRWPWHRDP